VATALELVRKRNHHDHELLQNHVIVCAQLLFSTTSKAKQLKMLYHIIGNIMPDKKNQAFMDSNPQPPLNFHNQLIYK